jgi:pimeloyl-ACP methyl ester carboxylesterase
MPATPVLPYRDVLGCAMVMSTTTSSSRTARSRRSTRHADSAASSRTSSLLDTWNELRGFADMGGLVYPQIQGLDFRRDVPRLDVPVYFVQGRHELTARSSLADEWIAQLQAPIKRAYTFADSGHNADAEEPGRYNDLLVTTVLAETYGR